MIQKFKKSFNLNKYKAAVNSGTNVNKVSFYFKKDFNLILKKRLLVLDFEFSMNKHIFEIGGFVIEDRKITQYIFKEYSLPAGEPVWDFEKNKFVVNKINPTKSIFNEQKWLFDLIDSVDYVVVHNYVAESGCLFKLKYPGVKYESTRCKLIQEGKFICTAYSFKNKFFKSLGLTKGSNSEVSQFFEWQVIEEDDKIHISSHELRMTIRKPVEVVGKLHNAFFDSVITLTNLLSLHFISKEENKC